MGWNPSAPSAFGLEWPVTRDVPSQLSAEGVLLGARNVSSVTEDIDNERVYLQAVSGTPTLAMDVYDESLATLAGIARQGYRTSVPWALPTATVAAGSFTAVGAPSLWEAIDDGAAYSEADYITATGSSPCSFRLNTLTTPSGGPMWAGRRIMGLGFQWYAASPGYPLSGGTLYPFLSIGGGTYFGSAQYVPANSSVGVLSSQSYWTQNPATFKPWTIAEIEAFATASAFGLQWYGSWGAYIAVPVRVFALYPTVWWVDETRAALGTGASSATAAWQTFDLSTPDYYNMLTAQQASLESAVLGTTGWAAVSNCSLARTTAFADTGAASLRMTATGAGTMTARTGSDLVEAPRVVPTRTYAARIRIRPVTVARTVSVAIEWSDESGVILSTSTGAASAETGGAFKEYTSVAAAPAGAAHADVLVTVTAAGAGESHDVDGIMLTPETVPAVFVAGGAVGRTFYEKRSGKNYVRMLRRLGASGSARVPGPSAETVTCPNAGWQNYRTPTVKSVNGRSDGGAIDSLGALSVDASPVILTTTAAAVSADSQPYIGFPTSGGRVYTGNTIQQEFTTSAIATLAIPQVVVSGPLGAPTANLTIKIKRRSDNVQFGGDATITPAQLTGDGTIRRSLLSTLASAATLAAGTQYYFEYSSTTPSTKPWQLGVLYTAGSGNTAGFGGTTDNFTDPALGAERQDMDAYAVLSTQPAALSPFTAAVVTPSGTTIHAVRLTWAQPVPSTGFARYEIERDDGAGFFLIKTETTLTTVTFDDPHARLNVATNYRIRWFRSDGAASAYATLATPITRTSTGCKYELVRAGVDPTLWVHADDFSDGHREYEIDDGTLVVEDLYDDDARFASRATERRGDRFTIHLGLYGGLQQPVSAALRGRRAFDQIFALVDAAGDYLVIHDSDGNRWFAAVDLENPTVTQPGDFHEIDVLVVELDPAFVEPAA